jgi:uncharacterized protein with FMN-binding domain/succinate dehydrogenase/fumarate reductase flavoprotein subunit
MKKIISIFLTCAMLASLAGCSSPQQSNDKLPATEANKKPAIVAGNYTSKVTSIGGPLTVEVTLDDSSITSVKVKDTNDTDGIASVAFERIANEVVKNQSVNVDTVSGATLSSVAMINAVKEAVSQGCDVSLFSKAAPYIAPVFDGEADVVVIGAGFGGLSAAISSANEGLSVVLAETKGYTGGTGLVANGGMARDPQSIENENFHTTMKSLSDQAGFELIASDAYEGYSVRADEGRSSMGTMVAAMEDLAEKLGVKILFETTCEGLLVEDGTVNGVKVSPLNGEPYTIPAKAVVLATGGFAGNDELVSKYLPQYSGARTSTLPGVDGAALTWIEDVDGATYNLDTDANFYSINPTTGYHATNGTSDHVYVDNTGSIFADTLDYSGVPRQAQLKFGNETYYSIISAEKAQANGMMEEIEHLLISGAVVEYDSIKAIADKYNLPNLMDTMTDLGYKNETKFYVSPTVGTIYSAYGGIVIDTEARVMNNSGVAVPGLYAAGEIIGSLCYRDFGYYYGQLAPAAIWGTIAGKTIASDLQ